MTKQLGGSVYPSMGRHEEEEDARCFFHTSLQSCERVRMILESGATGFSSRSSLIEN